MGPNQFPQHPTPLEAYSPPASDDEEALPALEPVEQPLTPIVVNHPAWFGPAAFSSLPLPDSLLADPIAAYRRLPMEEPEIETVMEDSPSTDEMHSSSLISTIVWPLCIIWETWLLGVRWQVLLLLLPTATCGLLLINEGAEVLTSAPEGSQVTFGSTFWLLSFVYLAWALGVPRQDLLPFVAGAAFSMLPSVEGARTRRSARFGLTAEERTAINILDAVPVVVWIVLSFAYRLRRQAALALRKRALSCFQRHLAQSKLLANARATIATRALLSHPPRALPLEVGCDKNGVLPRSNRGMDRFLRARRFLRGQSPRSSFLIARRDAPHSGLSFGSSSASAAARPRAPRSAAARTASPPLLVIDRRSARSARSAGGARRRRASRRLVSCRIGSHGDAGRAVESLLHTVLVG